MEEVVFRIGSRECAVTPADAEHVEDYLHDVAADSHLWDFKQQLRHVIRARGGELRIDDTWRLDLIDILDRIETGGRLTPGLRALRDELMKGPILLTDQPG